MKNFIIAVLLLLIIAGLMTANILYQKDVLARIDERLAALPDNPDEAASACAEILELWREERTMFSLTMQEHETERITTALTELVSFSSSGDKTMYLCARDASIEASRLLSDAEKLSFSGIF